MKTKLLNQINFNAIEPMSDKQMVELNGGGAAEFVIGLIIGIIIGSQIGGDTNQATNCHCPRGN